MDNKEPKILPPVHWMFRFTQDDLSANEGGVISPQQYVRLRRTILNRIMIIMLHTAIILATAFPVWTVFFFGLVLGVVRPVMLTLTNVVALMVAGAATLVVLHTCWHLFNLLRDYRLGQVNRSEGVALNYKRFPDVYFLYIGAMQFLIPSQSFNDGEFYRVYYTPYSRTILLAEKLSPDPFE